MTKDAGVKSLDVIIIRCHYPNGRRIDGYQPCLKEDRMQKQWGHQVDSTEIGKREEMYWKKIFRAKKFRKSDKSFRQVEFRNQRCWACDEEEHIKLELILSSSTFKGLHKNNYILVTNMVQFVSSLIYPSCVFYIKPPNWDWTAVANRWNFSYAKNLYLEKLMKSFKYYYQIHPAELDQFRWSNSSC